MTNRCWLLLLVACSAPPSPAPAPPPPPMGAYVEYQITGEYVEPASPPASPASPANKDQPPHVKLLLGHYHNPRFNIGVTIDRTEATDNVADIDPAKLRFDGDDKIWRLEGQPGAYGRTEYVRERGRVMLLITREGRVTVYVPDPETDRSTEVDVYRDADADPL